MLQKSGDGTMVGKKPMERWKVSVTVPLAVVISTNLSFRIDILVQILAFTAVFPILSKQYGA